MYELYSEMIKNVNEKILIISKEYNDYKTLVKQARLEYKEEKVVYDRDIEEIHELLEKNDEYYLTF